MLNVVPVMPNLVAPPPSLSSSSAADGPLPLLSLLSFKLGPEWPPPPSTSSSLSGEPLLSVRYRMDGAQPVALFPPALPRLVSSSDKKRPTLEEDSLS